MQRLCTYLLIALIYLQFNPSQAAEKCGVKPDNGVELLRSYSEKNGNTPDIFSVAAVGNPNFMLDENYLPESPGELGVLIMNSPKFSSAKRVLLVWPYSTMRGSFAPALAAIVHKPVIGFSGPLWWYPDGTAVATQPDKGINVQPDAANVTECLTSDGKYHEKARCSDLMQNRKATDAIFGNVAFMLSCDEVKTLTAQAEKEDAPANLRLYFYNYFVNIDNDKAIQYLSKAASLGDPTANYLVSQSLRNSKSVAGRKLYLQTLKRAADGGIEKAKTELAAVPKP